MKRPRNTLVDLYNVEYFGKQKLKKKRKSLFGKQNIVRVEGIALYTTRECFFFFALPPVDFLIHVSCCCTANGSAKRWMWRRRRRVFAIVVQKSFAHKSVKRAYNKHARTHTRADESLRN